MNLGLITLFWPLGYDGTTGTAIPLDPGWQITHGRVSSQVSTALSAKNWAVSDAWVNGLVAYGIRPFVIIDPNWTHAGEIALRYKGRVFAYEVGNEIDTWGSPGWDATYLDRYAAIRTAIKVSDPLAQVTWGSMHSIQFGGQAQRLMSKFMLAGSQTDAINVHCYDKPDFTACEEGLVRVRALMRDFRYEGVPIYATEVGVNFPKFSGTPPDWQDETICSAIKMLKRQNVAIGIWYARDDSAQFGLTGNGTKDRWNKCAQ